jgi:hypothetical protein
MRAIALAAALLVVGCFPKEMIKPQYSGPDAAIVTIMNNWPYGNVIIVDDEPVFQFSGSNVGDILLSPGVHVIIFSNYYGCIPFKRNLISGSHTFLVVDAQFAGTMFFREYTEADFKRLLKNDDTIMMR